jgi:hypothetical protein
MSVHFKQESGTAKGVSIVLVMLVIIETLVLHVLLSTWSLRLALVLDVVSMLSILWLIAGAVLIGRANITIEGSTLVIKNGLRGSACCEIDQISEVAYASIDSSREGDFSLAPSSSSVVLTLASPQEISGPLGVKLLASRIGVAPTNPETFIGVLKRIIPAR